MHKDEIAGSDFVVARGQAAKQLEPTHRSLDMVALPVTQQVHRAGYAALGRAGDDSLGAESRHGSQHLMRVVDFVGQYFAGFANDLQQLQCLSAIVLLARAQHGVHRSSSGVC
jgi:hypothetical protein